MKTIFPSIILALALPAILSAQPLVNSSGVLLVHADTSYWLVALVVIEAANLGLQAARVYYARLHQNHLDQSKVL